MRPLTPLCELAIKHKSDKGGRHLRYGAGDCHATHEYTPVYWDLLHTQREIVKNVLEIGVNKGCGLRMWEEFFPNARIIGVDINRECLFQEGRIETFYADQNSAASMTHALMMAGPKEYDVIIDDGSHEILHQGNTMAGLLPILSDIGVYVIEDIPKDAARSEYLLSKVPDGFRCSAIFPQLAHGQGWPEQLFVVTRE